MEGFYRLPRNAAATAYKQMDNASVRALWSRFLLTEGEVEISPCEELVFRIGGTAVPELAEGGEYALTIDENGAAVVGKDYGGLMRGFYALLMKIRQEDGQFVMGCTREQSRYLLKNRMIHICIFPETDLYYAKKLVRLAALCQYTHVVIEFWGMLRYDCLPELAWPQAFTKEQARELIRECYELGIEPVPMFNQLGHATASRLCYGKHVVLDQNPKLERLFTPDGWAWNIASDEVKALLKNIRTELYELFGAGSYMHIGCDEAYFISGNPALRKLLPDFLGELTHAVEREGRRPMLWMDMLLEKDAFPGCYAAGEKDEVEKIRRATAPSTVFVDWQYDCDQIPVPSTASLKDCGRDVIGAPWYRQKNQKALIQTAAEHDLFGIMLTTWHTLNMEMPSVLNCAKQCGAVSFAWSDSALYSHTETATLLRRVSFEGNSYGDSGWFKRQIEV